MKDLNTNKYYGGQFSQKTGRVKKIRNTLLIPNSKLPFSSKNNQIFKPGPNIISLLKWNIQISPPLSTN